MNAVIILSMKNIGRLLMLWLALSMVFVSCRKDEEPEWKDEEERVHYISSSQVSSIPAIFSRAAFTVLATQYSAAVPLPNQVKYNAEVHTMVYETRLKGDKINASGVVSLPAAPGTYPVLCFQNGTNTLHADAPSKNPSAELFQVLEAVAGMGFIVVIPDYLGFGESEQVMHPYLHAESTVESVLDMLRATAEFTVAESRSAKPSGDVFLLGYSQGGWATLHIQKAIEQKHSDEFTLIASAAGAGPYNLSEVNHYIVNRPEYPMPYFLAYVLVAYRSLGLFSNSLSDIFMPEYAAKLEGLFDGKHSGDAINAQLTVQTSGLFTSGYLAGYQSNASFATIRSALAANSVAAWNMKTPTRLLHGDQDTYIPISIAEDFLAQLRGQGVTETTCSLVILPGAGHSSGVLPAGLNALSWFVGMK